MFPCWYVVTFIPILFCSSEEDHYYLSNCMKITKAQVGLQHHISTAVQKKSD